MEEPREENEEELAARLAAALGLSGAGRVEIELNDAGEVKALWTHERRLCRPRAEA